MIINAQSQNIVIEKRFKGFWAMKLLILISLTFNMSLKPID